MNLQEARRIVAKANAAARKAKYTDEEYRAMQSRFGKLGGWPKGKPRKIKEEGKINEEGVSEIVIQN